MATMKAKNSAGEWVEVDSAISRGANLYIDQLQATDNHFDLTKYVNCNHFILFYTAYTTNSTSPKYTIYVYDSQNTDGYAYIYADSANTYGVGIYELFDYTGKQNNDAAFIKSESVSGSFITGSIAQGGTLEDMQFSHPNKTLGTYGVIIYAM